MDWIQYYGVGIAELSYTHAAASLQGNTPILHISLEMPQFFPNNYPEGFNSFTILNCEGELKTGEITVVGSVVTPKFFRQGRSVPELKVPLTRETIALIEEYRNGLDVHLNLNLKLLCAFDKEKNFMTPMIIGEAIASIRIIIAKSKWLEEILHIWDYYLASEIIIPIVNSKHYESVREHVANARRAYSQNNYRETLSCTYRSIEALHKSFGHSKFEDMMQTYRSKSSDSKHEKIAAMFKQVLGYLHFARHDQTTLSGTHETKVISREDAELALIYVQMIINYVIKQVDLFKSS